MYYEELDEPLETHASLKRENMGTRYEVHQFICKDIDGEWWVATDAPYSGCQDTLMSRIPPYGIIDAVLSAPEIFDWWSSEIEELIEPYHE